MVTRTAALYAALPLDTGLTIELRDALCESLRAGVSLTAACAASGVNRKTVYDWRVRGKREPASAYGDFRDAIRKARGRGEVRYVACVAKAATEDWRAAAWALEHLYDRAATQRHEVSGPKGRPIEFASLTPDERRARIATLLAKRDDADRARGD